MFKSLKTSKWKTYFDNTVCKVRPSSDFAPFMRRTQCKLELKRWLFAHLHWVRSMKRKTSKLGLSLNLFLISSFWNFFYTAYKLPPNITPQKKTFGSCISPGLITGILRYPQLRRSLLLLFFIRSSLIWSLSYINFTIRKLQGTL